MHKATEADSTSARLFTIILQTLCAEQTESPFEHFDISIAYNSGEGFILFLFTQIIVASITNSQ